MSFLLSSSIGMVVFTRASKIYEQGKDPVSYLIRGTVLYFGAAFVSLIGIYVFSGNIYHALYGDTFSWNPVILLLILVAKIFQSYLFLLINYERAILKNNIVYWVSGIMAVQALMFWLNHGSLLQIAINILIPSVMGSAGIMITILINKNRFKYITG
jgi:O-antigen/teichoic acid export membrane protein